MPRRHRIWFPGAIYHITSRGNKRENIFLDDEDHLMYLTLLKETQELQPYILHSYCLMSNHLHLLIEMNNHPISDIMKKIQTHYAIYYNKRYDSVGHVFQDRFRADLIKDVHYFLNANRYIHTNPIEANITTNLQDYRWSSIFAYLSPSDANSLVTTERILSYFPEPKLENYQKFLLKPRNDKEVLHTCLS